MIFKEILLFSSGAAIGAVLGLKIAEKRFNDKLETEVNRRVDDIMAQEASRRTEEENKIKVEKATKARQDKKQKVQYSNVASDYVAHGVREVEASDDSDISEEDEDSDDEDGEEAEDRLTKEYEHPEDDVVNPYPYKIPDEEFDDLNNGYDKCSWYYYGGNGMLVDDSDTVIEKDYPNDAMVALGDHWEDDAIEQLHKNGPTVVYIRNEKLKTDYELVLSRSSYPLD